VDGKFSFPELPAGTTVLEARAIGHEPRLAMVDVAEQITTTATLVLSREAQQLETVNVVGKASREVKLLNEIHERGVVSAGTQFLPGNSWLAAAFDPSDVLRGARGFIIKGATQMETRLYYDSNQQQMLPCVTDGLLKNRSKEIAVYIDGMRTPGGLETLNNNLRMDQVLAMETYADVVSAPFIWRNSTTCAVIAVWTKR
jgi:hypothetical protein